MNSYAVLVVGAGASNEYDLPLGSELKERISDLLEFRFDHSRYPTKGDRIFFDALTTFEADFPKSVSRVNELLEVGRLIEATLPQAPSIDQFIFNRSGDLNVELVGKLAIARALLAAEQTSKVSLHYPDLYGAPRRGFVDWDISGTWLPSFFALLIDRCASLDEVAQRITRVKIVSFNYDRVIKHYLFNALKNYFPDRDDDVRQAVLKLEVVHPYGSLGPLDWEDADNGLAFGRPVKGGTLAEVASRIKTFNESINEDLRASAQDMLSRASMVMFLGFGYHQQNVDLLETPIGNQARIFGTARGLSEFDQSEISDELSIKFQVKRQNVFLFDGGCSAIFSYYSRALKLVGF